MTESTIFVLVLAGIAGFVGMIWLLAKHDLEVKRLESQKAPEPRRGLLGWITGDAPDAVPAASGPLPDEAIERLADRVADRVTARLERDRALLLELAKMDEAEFAAYKAALVAVAPPRATAETAR